MPWLPYSLPVIIAFLVSALINFILVRRWIPPLVILAQVNRRSAHKVPVPVGGGIGILAGMGASLPLLLPSSLLQSLLPLAFSCLGLGIISWWNDKVDLPARIRLVAQLLAVLITFYYTAPNLLLPYFAPWLGEGWLIQAGGLLVLGLGLLWFTNLYNFMDGSDGIMAVETLSISLGMVLLLFAAGDMREIYHLQFCIAAATLAFLLFNWPPARLFAGDVGSIPIGFFTGFMLILFALHVSWKAAILLPLYFAADATITLGKRLLRREKIWQAHSSHYFQQAIRKGFSHRRVMLTVGALNGFLVLCALATLYLPLIQTYIAMLFAVLAVMLCLWHFRKPV